MQLDRRVALLAWIGFAGCVATPGSGTTRGTRGAADRAPVPAARIPAAEPVEKARAEPPGPRVLRECPANIGVLAGDKPSNDELRTGAGALIECWVAAFNARDVAALTRTYSDVGLEYQWESASADIVIARQIEELKDVAFVEHHADVRIDSFQQVTVALQLVTSKHESRGFLATMRYWEHHLSIQSLNDLGQAELSARCSAAVANAMEAIPDIQRWRRTQKNERSGGFVTPLRKGKLELTLGPISGGSNQTIYRASLQNGHLRVVKYSSWDLVIPGPVADRVRKACVPFKDDCVDTCATLGQCARKNGTCVADDDEQCQNSEACTTFGQCHAGGRFGECVAKSQAECAKVDCGNLPCSLVGTTCQIPAPPPGFH